MSAEELDKIMMGWCMNVKVMNHSNYAYDFVLLSQKNTCGMQKKLLIQSINYLNLTYLYHSVRNVSNGLLQ